MDKTELRKQMRKKRKSIPLEEMKGKSEKIKGHFLNLPEIMDANTVALYFPIEKEREVDTREIIRELKKMGKRVALPRVEGDSLEFYEFAGFEDMEKNEFGILEPKKGKRIDLKEIDVLAIPVVALDRDKRRIGMGKGYYDRVWKEIKERELEFIIKVVALAYSFQVVGECACSEEDICADVIVTEKRFDSF